MELTLLKDPSPEKIPLGCEDFLRSLKGPTAIYIKGKDPSRTRVLVTLSHGDEPSGFRAVHQWMREGKEPAVNALIIFGAVEAALAEPLFSHRYLPGKRDLNRCFSPPYRDSQGVLAQAICQLIHKSHPEFVVDMHNTSGMTPAFAVSFGHSLEKQILAGNFVNTLVVSQLRIGSLMEQDFKGPTITVEVGGSADPKSLTVATEGMDKYFLRENLFELSRQVSIINNPLRLELSSDVKAVCQANHKKQVSYKVGYSESILEGKDITLRNDIESLNLKTIEANECLGWTTPMKFNDLRVRGADRVHSVGAYFSIREGKLYPRHPMRLLMATQCPEMAISDCLFYFVKL